MFTNGHDIQFLIFLVIVGGVGSLIIYLWYLLMPRRVIRTTMRAEHAVPKPEPAKEPELVIVEEPIENAMPDEQPVVFPHKMQVPENLPVAASHAASFLTPMEQLFPIIEIRNLRKVYPARGKGAQGLVEAVREISFSVGRGEIFGLLGPNGAGKTTTMRMLCTLLVPTSGTATIAGHDLIRDQIAIRRTIGYVSQVGGMQRETTGRENLLLQAKLYGMPHDEANTRVAELIQLFDLGDFADRKTATYSGGQRRIFDLACGIVHRPQLLFLDEPSTGLDPQNRAHVWEQVQKLRDQGTTIFVTTHYLEEADMLCDRVAIVDRGRVVAIGTPEELKQQIAGDVATLSVADESTAKAVAALFQGESYVREVSTQNEVVHLYVDKGDENLPVIMRNLHDRGVTISTIQLSRPSLDDVFLKLTGRSFSAE